MSKAVLGVDVGRKNLAMCLVEPGLDFVDDVILGWAVVSIDPTPAGVIAGLKSIENWPPATHVAIERQPNKNPTMKRLEHQLEMYFATAGVPATVIDAKHKLSFAAQTPWWPTRSIDTWSYHERKKLSVETVTAMLSGTAQSQEIRDTFEKSRKKDDLADACLHAMAFAHNLAGRLDDGPRAARKIKPVKPTPQHVSSGKYTQAGLKHLCAKHLASRDVFDDFAQGVKGFEASCVRHFDTVDNAYVQLGGKTR